MQPDLDAVAEASSDRVELIRVNGAVETELARRLGVRGTPTLIGVSEGREVFRSTGRRSRHELERLFDAVGSGDAPADVGRHSLVLRLGAVAVLAVLGLLSGPAWPLVAIAAGVAVLSMVAWLRRAR